MTLQQMGEQDDGYAPPQVLKNSGPPRAIYLAPVYRFEGKRRTIIGERLTSFENPLSAEGYDVERYRAKGFKLATKEDIARLVPLPGHLRLFSEPLDSLEQFGIKQPQSPHDKYLELKLKEAEQKIAVLEAEEKQRKERAAILRERFKKAAEKKAAKVVAKAEKEAVPA